MRRQSLGALYAPDRLSLWTEYLHRLKRARAARPRANRARRRVTLARLAHAEFLLGRILDGADLLAITGPDRPRDRHEQLAHLLVSIHPMDFRFLCEFGAETEDDEAEHDNEPTEADDGEDDGSNDLEASLGAGEMTDQRAWAAGRAAGEVLDGERDAEAEPSLGSVPDMDQREWASGTSGRTGSFDLESDSLEHERGGEGKI